MQIPGFNAEAAIYKAKRNYRTVGGRTHADNINNSLNLAQAAFPLGIFDPFSCILDCGRGYSDCLGICKYGSYVMNSVCAKRCWNNYLACRLGCMEEFSIP